MLVRKARLIQSINEYLAIINPVLQQIIAFQYPYEMVNKEEIIKWIIAEELELIYCLFDKQHQHNKYPHEFIHNQLTLALHVDLSIITSAYIKAPVLYLDYNTIEVKLICNDLYIDYFGCVPSLYTYSPRKNNVRF